MAAGLLSFKHMSPYARARFQIDLRKLVTARGGLSEDGSHFDKAIASDVLSELVEERGMRQFVIELTKRARRYMDDDKIEQLEADMSYSCAIYAISLWTSYDFAGHRAWGFDEL